MWAPRQRFMAEESYQRCLRLTLSRFRERSPSESRLESLRWNATSFNLRAREIIGEALIDVTSGTYCYIFTEPTEDPKSYLLGETSMDTAYRLSDVSKYPLLGEEIEGPDELCFWISLRLS